MTAGGDGSERVETTSRKPFLSSGHSADPVSS